MLEVVELFAGVGGFRLGLEKNKNIKVIWGNQWEPSTKSQPAFECYSARFKEGTHVNDDIAKVWNDLPNHDVLVGGFPCQDYSVARTLSGEQGIRGKKGVLFWEIMNIVNNRKPKYVLLENVDRLLKSPSKQRGRDFAIMLAAFRDAGYNLEWRVINAADYGFAQRRRRVFIFAYHMSTLFAVEQTKLSSDDILHNNGFFSKAFPVLCEASARHKEIEIELTQDILTVSDTFTANFRNSGVMINGKVLSKELLPKSVPSVTLGEILLEARKYQGQVDEKYYLSTNKVNKKGRTEYEELQYQKGAKKEKRVSNTGHEYYYAEGSMAFPDRLDLPSRTMLTSEGSCNRSSHVVEDLDTGRLRYLTPIECELLNGFPAGWTDTGMLDRKRYFCMGNALVVGLIERMGKRLYELHKDEVKSNYVDQLTLV